MKNASDKLDITSLPLPKATAVWLIENTGLTFEQIGNFTDMPELEVQATADEEVNRGIIGRNAIDHGELTAEEIARCEADPSAQLKLKKNDLPKVKTRSKGPKYTPVARRADKPDAVAYLLKNNPELSDAQIVKLVGTTKPTIQAIRDRSHANMANIKPRNPADIGICSYAELDKAYDKALRAAGNDPEAIKAQKAGLAAAENESDESDSSDGGGMMAGFDFSKFMQS